MAAQVCFNDTPLEATAGIDSVGTSIVGESAAATSIVESVARVVSGITVIGKARDALDAAGWTATIAANRITVAEGVLAQLIPAKMGTFGPINASWIVYSVAGTDPV